MEYQDVVLLAQAPGQVADQGPGSGAVVFRGSRSGNKNFDPKTGRFAGAGASRTAVPANQNPVPVNRSGLPQGVSQEEWERRLDTVRDAARTSPTMNPQEAAEFLRTRVQDLSKIDIAQFILDVRAQRIDDLVDSLAGSGGDGPTLSTSSKWVSNVFGDLQDTEIANIARRLGSRGLSEKKVIKTVFSKIKDEDRRKTIGSSIGIELEDIEVEEETDD
jgi:hypothetical protein